MRVTSEYRFAPIPEELLYDKRISSTAVRIYATLARHGMDPGSCFPSHARIAELLGMSERSIGRPLGELESAGWITVTERYHDGGGRASNGYTVHTASRTGGEQSARQSDMVKPRESARPPRAQTRGERKQENESKEEPVVVGVPAASEGPLAPRLVAVVDHAVQGPTLRSLHEALNLSRSAAGLSVQPLPRPGSEAHAWLDAQVPYWRSLVETWAAIVACCDDHGAPAWLSRGLSSPWGRFGESGDLHHDAAVRWLAKADATPVVDRPQQWADDVEPMGL